VPENKFLAIVKYFCKNPAVPGGYEKVFPHCDNTAYLPCGENLKTVTISECRLLGYGKRINKKIIRRCKRSGKINTINTGDKINAEKKYSYY